MAEDLAGVGFFIHTGQLHPHSLMADVAKTIPQEIVNPMEHDLDFDKYTTEELILSEKAYRERPDIEVVR